MIVPGSRSDLTLIYCGKAGSGHLSRSFALNRRSIRLKPGLFTTYLPRWPQIPRLQRFVRSRILTVQASTFPLRSVTKTLHAKGLQPHRDDRISPTGR